MTFNLASLFEANADAFPDRLAVVCGDRTCTFGELDVRATRLANAWSARGVRPGQHIGLYLYNSIEYIECMLAAFKLRAVTINVNYRYVTEELRYIFTNADLVGVVYEPDLATNVAGALTPAMHLRIERGPAYEALIAEASSERRFPARSGDDLFVLYTGGTTGMPRGVMWRHEDLFFAALQGGNPGGAAVERAEDLAPLVHSNGDGIHILSGAPLIHGAAQLGSWIALLNGGVAGLTPGRGFDPIGCLDLVDAHEMNAVSIVGDAMAVPLVDALEAHPGRWRLGSLAALTSAGAVLSGTLREKLEKLIPSATILNNFGASETGHQGSAFYEGGRAIWVMDEHNVVVDEHFQPVLAGGGVVGRLARRGRIPLGYYGDPEKTAATFFVHEGVRYVIPGDLATVDDEGSIVFLGRGAACINSGGEKVFAEEVEEALKAHAAVEDAVVVGVPDERWGQRVEALVRLRGPATVGEIEAFCRTKVAGYKVPRRIHLVPDLHRQPSGKPDYRWAQARAVELGSV
jgi:acyl-CoA synthetase (AMP-forming)/AMP-acid ligase II